MQNVWSAAIEHPIADCTIYAVEINQILTIQQLRFGIQVQKNSDSKYLDSYKQMIIDYLNGLSVDLSILPLDLSRYTFFQKKILNTLRTIPYGNMISYEELAYKSGFPGACRAVGSVMRKNVFPIIIPCHRVVLKSGKAGGYCGEMLGDFAELKVRLLKLERDHSSFIKDA